MLISPAFAQDAAAAAGGDVFASFLPLILILFIFYFLLIRPQQKKFKQHQKMLETLRRGDKVVTAGGIVGTVAKVKDDNEVELTIAKDVKVTVIRSMIQTTLSKPEPAEAAKTSAKDKKDKDAGKA